MRVAFIHYLVGERDGVSLEIEKRAKVFLDLGWQVSYISGYDGLNRAETYIIPDFNIKNDWNLQFLNQSFENSEVGEITVYRVFNEKVDEIFSKLDEALGSLKPDLIYVHNVFAHGYNLAATSALLKALDKYKIPTVSVNHDFWFERDKFLNPKYFFVQEILDSLPPDREYILKHQVINSIAEKELSKRRNIKAERIADYFNFDIVQVEKDSYNSDLKSVLGIAENDLVVLQATRVTGRKGIENAIKFVAELQKQFTEKKVHLLLPNFIEADCEEYASKLQKLAATLNVNAIWASQLFMPERRLTAEGRKIYSFWDAYLITDLVTYPSFLEGFGNQLLEAIYFHKLPIVFEYPVFREDIKKEGYEYVSLGSTVTAEEDGLKFVSDSVIAKAVSKSLEFMDDVNRLSALTRKNFEIARTNHNHDRLQNDIKEIIQKIGVKE